MVGPVDERLGSRFIDMSEVYSQRYRRIAISAAKDLGFRLVEGVYAAHSGPSYETPAEIRLFRRLGGDAIGMSTVPEIIVARQMGLECLAISMITNMAAGLTKKPLSHAEVLSTAERGIRFFKLLKNLCSEILKLE
jgi:purine-nucleoside phosphorylase